MAIFFGIVVLILVLVFGVSSIMQSYASAQQAQAVVETARAAQLATLGNVVVIVVMVLVLLLVLIGVGYVAVKLRTSRTPQSDKRNQRLDRIRQAQQSRLEAGRQHGQELRSLFQQMDENKESEHAHALYVADQDDVDEFLDRFLQ